MKKCHSWVVVFCLLWFALAMPIQAASIPVFEMPEYQSLLEREAGLSPKMQTLQQLLQGKIVATPEWVKAHPELANQLFDELLSDAVLTGSSAEAGLIADPGPLLARLAEGAQGRIAHLYSRYLLWVDDDYNWSSQSEYRLEREFAALIDYLEVDWDQTLWQLPRIGDGRLPSSYSSIIIREAEPKPFQPPELMQRWKESEQAIRHPEENLAEIFSGLRFARELSYPEMEIRLLNALEDVLAKYGLKDQAIATLERAKGLAKATGFDVLAADIDFALSLYSQDLTIALQDFQRQIVTVANKEHQAILSIWAAIYLINSYQFKTAAQILQTLTQDLTASFADRALQIAVAVRYPFARDRLLLALASSDSDERQIALEALHYLSEPGKDQSETQFLEDEFQKAVVAPQDLVARRNFYKRLAQALNLSLQDSDTKTQLLTLKVWPKLYKIKELSQPALTQLLPFMSSPDSDLRNAAIKALYAQKNSLPIQVRQQLLPFLKSFDELGQYYLLELIQGLKGPEVIQALEIFLQDSETSDWLWVLAWKQLQVLDSAKALQILNLSCQQIDSKSEFKCLSAYLGLDVAVLPEQLLKLFKSYQFGPEAFTKLPNQLPEANLIGLMDLLRQSEPQVLHHVMASLKSATRFERLTLALRQKLQVALEPLLKHPNTQIRLQATELYLSQHNQQAQKLINQLLISKQAEEFLLALTVLQSWHPEKEDPPAVPLDRLNMWLEQPDQVLTEPLLWTQARSNALEPLRLHQALAELLSESWVNPPSLPAAELLSLIKHPEPAIRMMAIERLGRIGDPGYAGKLQNLLEDSDDEIRITAYRSLLKLYKSQFVYYLKQLQNPDLLPDNTDQLLSLIMQDQDAAQVLMESEQYEHLRTRQVYRDALWELLPNEQNPNRLAELLYQFLQAPETLEVPKVLSLIAPENKTLTQAAGLRLMLRHESLFNPADIEAFQNDSEIVLQLGLLQHWMVQAKSSLAQSLMKKLSKQIDFLPEPSHVAFVWAFYPEELPDHATVEKLVQELLSDGYYGFEPDSSSLSNWLSWIEDRQLPLSWRQAILERVAESGTTSDLLPGLKRLIQEPELSEAANDVYKIIQQRLAEP